MFGRLETTPAKILKLNGEQWRQNEVLRVTRQRRFDGDPEAKRRVIHRHDMGEFALTAMHWGLTLERPGDEERAKPLNAVRAETIAEQIEWRRLLNTHRCVIPAEQFYEWLRIDGVKVREYAYRLRSRRPLMIAGLWNRSPSPSGRSVDSFCYVSCEANALAGQIHDRMPVILDDAGVAKWFDPDATLESLLDLLVPVDAGRLELQPVAPPSRKPYQPSLFPARAA